MSVAFVLGNGTSRKDIPLEPLRQYGKIYGCNAIYRTFDCDYLTAVDAKMVLEIAQSNYQMRIPVWTNPNKTFKDIKGLNFFNPSKGWSSGPTALDLATYHQHDTYYILGFDFKGTTGTIRRYFKLQGRKRTGYLLWQLGTSNWHNCTEKSHKEIYTGSKRG